MRYSHLFFDLDRTLWDLDKNVFETLGELNEIHRLNERGVDCVESFWKSYNIHNTALWQSWEKGLITRDLIRTERFVSILKDFDITDEKLALSLALDFLSMSPLKKNLVPGAEEILEHAIEKGHKLAIITNGFNDVQFIKMKNSGLDRYFTHVITSEDAGTQKPNPGIFEHALGITNGLAKNSLMIGDSLSADIEGAINAGIDNVFYNPLFEKHEFNVTHEISDLRELKNII